MSCRAPNRCETFHLKIQAAAANETPRIDISKEERRELLNARPQMSTCQRLSSDAGRLTGLMHDCNRRSMILDLWGIRDGAVVALRG